MTKEYDYNIKTDKEGKYNSLSIFEAIKQSVRTMSEFKDDDGGIPGEGGGDGHAQIGEFIPSVDGWDIRAALAWAQANVGSKSIGRCARYVRQMIEAGGMNTDGRPVSAYQYASYLPKKGFKHIASLLGVQKQADWSANEAQPGDIAVMEHGEHGHICMWTGVQWVSDFVQRKAWPYSGDGLINIFRFAGKGQS